MILHIDKVEQNDWLPDFPSATEFLYLVVDSLTASEPSRSSGVSMKSNEVSIPQYLFRSTLYIYEGRNCNFGHDFWALSTLKFQSHVILIKPPCKGWSWFSHFPKGTYDLPHVLQQVKKKPEVLDLRYAWLFHKPSIRKMIIFMTSDPILTHSAPAALGIVGMKRVTVRCYSPSPRYLNLSPEARYISDWTSSFVVSGSVRVRACKCLDSGNSPMECRGKSCLGEQKSLAGMLLSSHGQVIRNGINHLP